MNTDKELTPEEIFKKHILQNACMEEEEFNDRLDNGEFEPEFEAMKEYGQQQYEKGRQESEIKIKELKHAYQHAIITLNNLKSVVSHKTIWPKVIEEHVNHFKEIIEDTPSAPEHEGE